MNIDYQRFEFWSYGSVIPNYKNIDNMLEYYYRVHLQYLMYS